MRVLLFFLLFFALHSAVWFALFPGLMTPDALFQYAQMRTGEISNLHPPLMIYLWQWLYPYVPTPMNIFLLSALLYSLGSYLFITHATKHFMQRMLLCYLSLSPLMLVTLMNISKDALSLGFACLMLALLIRHIRSPSRLLLASLFVCTMLLAGLRHHALLALVPLIYLALIAYFIRLRRRYVALLTLCMTFVIGAGVYALNHYKVTSISMLPTVAMWDLAAISLEEDRLIIPSYAYAKNVGLAEAKMLFSPHSNAPLCQFLQGRGRLFYCMEKIPLRRGDALEKEEAERLALWWFSQIRNYPEAYISHRVRVMQGLFGLTSTGDYLGFNLLAAQPTDLHKPQFENIDKFMLPPVFMTPNPLAFEPFKKMLLEAREKTPLLKGWIYFAASLPMLCVFLFFQRGNPYRWMGTSVLISAWLSALPLFVITPSIQLRYLSFPVLLIIFSLGLLRLNPKRAAY